MARATPGAPRRAEKKGFSVPVRDRDVTTMLVTNERRRPKPHIQMERDTKWENCGDLIEMSKLLFYRFRIFFPCIFHFTAPPFPYECGASRRSKASRSVRPVLATC